LPETKPCRKSALTWLILKLGLKPNAFGFFQTPDFSPGLLNLAPAREEETKHHALL
jgi:hypothetical protein